MPKKSPAEEIKEKKIMHRKVRQKKNSSIDLVNLESFI